jgi:methyltransferase family protein
MSRVLDEHRGLLADPVRMAAFECAIAATVRPGDVVLDLASGTGILGLMACRAGAARVYCVDDGRIVDVARALAAANGYGDRMTFLMEHSTAVELPERVDAIIGDQVGHFGFEAGLIECYADARARLLKPGGRVLPREIHLCVALIDSADIRERVGFWSRPVAGFDLSDAAGIAVNTGYPLLLSSSEMISESVAGGVIQVDAPADDVLEVNADLRACRAGTVNAIGGWFVAELAPGIAMTNNPAAPDRMGRRQVAFPLGESVPVDGGEIVHVNMRIRPADHLIRWTVDFPHAPHRLTHSTWNGMLLPRETLARTRPEFAPRLTRRGKARQTVLDLCDGVRALADIEREVYERHRDLFASPDVAQTFVAEVVTRYGA